MQVGCSPPSMLLFALRSHRSVKRKAAKHALRQLSDEVLVQRIGEHDDRTSFGIIYERYRQRVLHHTTRMIGGRAQAEDLTQEVFLKLFKNAAKYRQSSAFAAWFKVMTYNVVIDELRKQCQIEKSNLRVQKVCKEAH